MSGYECCGGAVVGLGEVIVYNPAVRKFTPVPVSRRLLQPCALALGAILSLAAGSRAQDAQSAAGPPKTGSPKTKFQVNFLNPCRPAQTEAEEIARALARFKERPRFASDFEISRGVTTLSESEARAAGVSTGGGPSSWVRIRHEFPEKAPLSDAQYTLSIEGGGAAELLVLHPRDTKDVLQLLISAAVTGSATQAVQANTPAERIRLERLGKASVVLARCPGMDQAAYDPVFQAAGDILDKYRAAMSVKTVVPGELARLPGAKESGAKESGVKESKAVGASH